MIESGSDGTRTRDLRRDRSGRPLSLRSFVLGAPARQSRASQHLFQAVLSGLERTNVRATRSAADGSTMRDLA